MEVLEVTFAVSETAMKHFKRSYNQMLFSKLLVLNIASYRSGCPFINTKCKTFFKIKSGNYLHYYSFPAASIFLQAVIKQLYRLAPLPRR
jgi:hypothetical protein